MPLALHGLFLSRSVRSLAASAGRHTARPEKDTAPVRRGVTAVVLGIVLMVAAPAQASIITVTLQQFTDAAWSGTVSFDDTTGQPWNRFPPVSEAITAYVITDMTISDGTAIWTEDELDPSDVPPVGGLLVDAVGRVGLWIFATDTLTGVPLELGFEVMFGLFSQTFLSNESVGVAYTASIAAVSVPGALWLVASGVIGVGTVAWRRRR